MSLINRKGLLDAVSVCLQAKRFRGKINLKRPQQPHFEKARLLAITKPYYINPKRDEPAVCLKDLKLWNNKSEDNPLQKIFARELLQKFETAKMIGFCHLNPMNAEQHYKALVLFKREGMEYKNYGKATMEIALKGTPYETVLDFYYGHNMIVFSPELQISKMLKIIKKFPQLILLAGILEGKFVSKDDLTYYSNIPNIKMAQAQLVQTLSSIGGGVVNQLQTHQQILVSQLEERMKQLAVDDNK